MNRRRFLQYLPSGLLITAAPTIFLPPIGGWRPWENQRLANCEDYRGFFVYEGVDIAGGYSLDSLGEFNFVCRKIGEADNDFRKRILMESVQ